MVGKNADLVHPGRATPALLRKWQVIADNQDGDVLAQGGSFLVEAVQFAVTGIRINREKGRNDAHFPFRIGQTMERSPIEVLNGKFRGGHARFKVFSEDGDILSTEFNNPNTF
jgi:hypothetical protein